MVPKTGRKYGIEIECCAEVMCTLGCNLSLSSTMVGQHLTSHQKVVTKLIIGLSIELESLYFPCKLFEND